MLSLSGVSAGQVGSYYQKDDYYFSAQKEAEVILGRERVGDKITEEAFKELAVGRLEHAEKTGKNPRIADDLTFSAPKSVSLVAALDDNMREAIVQAHREAVGKVVEFIAHSGMIQARDSRGEPTAAWGAVAVRFDHFLSRNGDPQLHSHVLIANSVFYMEKEFDGRTVQVVEKEGAAYLRDIYTNKTALGALYRHELASRLERQGYEVEWKQDGTFELKGFTAEALKEFSTRRQEIEKHMAEKGVEGGKAAEVAALDTRKPKENLDPAKLRAEWEERAQKAGIEIPRPDPEKTTKIREEDREVDSRDRLVLAEREAEKQVRTAGFSSTLRVSLGLAKELASAGKTSTISEIVGLAEKGTREAGKHFGGLYDLGEDRIGSDVRRWFTFRNNIMAEFRHREIGLRENQKGIDPEKAHQSLQAFQEKLEREKGFRLDKNQEEMVLKIATGSTDGVLVGKAGTGKTTIMEAIRDVYESSDRAVLGVAPSGAAAKNLQKEAGIESYTIDSLLKKDFDNAERLRDGILIVDEAGLADATRISATLEWADKHGMKVLFVGDPDQVKPVQFGDPLPELVHSALEKGSLFELDRIFRQKHEEYREAAQLAATRQTVDSLKKLEKLGWVKEYKNSKDMIRAAVNEYLQAVREGRSILVVSEANKTVEKINKEVRYHLKEEGRIEKNGITVETRNTEGRKTGEKEFVVGDRVLFLRNDSRQGVKNGDVGTITGIDHELQSLQVKLDSGEDLVVGLKNYNYLTYGYAMTVHKSQGQTVDRVIYVSDTKKSKGMINANIYYVGITRGKHEAKVFTNDLKTFKKQIAVPAHKVDVAVWSAGRYLPWEVGETKEKHDQEALKAVREDAQILRNHKEDYSRGHYRVANGIMSLSTYQEYRASHDLSTAMKTSQTRQQWLDADPATKRAIIERERNEKAVAGKEKGVLPKDFSAKSREEAGRESVGENRGTKVAKDGGYGYGKENVHGARGCAHAYTGGYAYTGQGRRPPKEYKATWRDYFKYGLKAKYYEALRNGQYGKAELWGWILGMDTRRVMQDIGVQKAVRGEINPDSWKFKLVYGREAYKRAKILEAYWERDVKKALKYGGLDAALKVLDRKAVDWLKSKIRSAFDREPSVKVWPVPRQDNSLLAVVNAKREYGPGQDREPSRESFKTVSGKEDQQKEKEGFIKGTLESYRRELHREMGKDEEKAEKNKESERASESERAVDHLKGLSEDRATEEREQKPEKEEKDWQEKLTGFLSETSHVERSERSDAIQILRGEAGDREITERDGQGRDQESGWGDRDDRDSGGYDAGGGAGGG